MRPLVVLALIGLPTACCHAHAGTKVKAIAISPKPLVIHIDQDSALTAQLQFDGAADPNLKPTWSVTGPIGSIDAGGNFTAGPQRARGTVSATAGGQAPTAVTHRADVGNHLRAQGYAY